MSDSLRPSLWPCAIVFCVVYLSHMVFALGPANSADVCASIRSASVGRLGPYLQLPMIIENPIPKEYGSIFFEFRSAQLSEMAGKVIEAQAAILRGISDAATISGGADRSEAQSEEEASK